MRQSKEESEQSRLKGVFTWIVGINFINNKARKLIPKLQDYQNTWLGHRPTLPDCLPVISKSPKFDNLYYAFGHNHLGWTLGPITGKIVTGLINKDKFDNQALEMNRFIK